MIIIVSLNYNQIPPTKLFEIKHTKHLLFLRNNKNKIINSQLILKNFFFQTRNHKLKQKVQILFRKFQIWRDGCPQFF